MLPGQRPQLPGRGSGDRCGRIVDDVVTAMRAASYETAFQLLYFLPSSTRLMTRKPQLAAGRWASSTSSQVSPNRSSQVPSMVSMRT